MPNVVLERMAAERDRINEQIDEVLAAAAAEERDPSESERGVISRQRARLEELEPQIVEMVALEEHRGQAADARSVLARAASPAVTTGAGTGVAVVDRGAPAVPWRTPGEFIVEHLRARGGMRDGHGILAAPDPAAIERMAHYVERALENQTTGDTPGILPTPIVGTVLGQKTAVQPFLTSIGGARPMGGIPGKTFTRPKITQHTLVGLQTAEKTALPSRKMVIGSVPFTKVTKGGSVDISRQDIDWTVPSAWDILLADLAAVYGEEVEEEAAVDFESKVTAAAVEVATNDLAGWAAALYEAAATVYNATSPRRLPDRLWLSTDVWAKVGPVVDVAIIAAGAQIADLMSTQGATGFSGNMFAIPRVVVPSLPAGTAIVGVSTAYEVYEEVVGVLSAVEPSLFGVEVAYGGYVAFNAVEPEGLVPLTAPPVVP